MITAKCQNLIKNEEINSLTLKKLESSVKELEGEKRKLMFDVDKYKGELKVC